MFRGPFQSNALKGERFFRWRGGDVSRLEGLADAVFALALTLLVVRLDVPRSFDEVRHAIFRAPVYVVCFALFVWIWYCHHQFHRRYGLEGPLTITLDAAILFVVLLFALPLRFVAELAFAKLAYGDAIVQRGADGEIVYGPAGETLRMIERTDGRLLMIFYAGGFALLFLLFVVQTWHAYRHADILELDEVERLVTRNTLRAHALSMTVGAVALLLALIGGKLGAFAGLVFFAMGPAHGLLGYLQGRRVTALAARVGGAIRT